MEVRYPGGGWVEPGGLGTAGVCNEDGAHHVISEVAGALVDIGFHDWSRTTGETAAQNLVTVAKALAATPFQVPVSD